MKKIVSFITIITIFILIANILVIYYLNQKHTTDHKNSLLVQTQHCGNHIEKFVSNYENELNRIIFYNSENMHLIFSDKEIMLEIINNLKSFYSKYRELLSNIAIYDDSNNYLGLYIKDNDEFVVDTFLRQRDNVLNERQMIIQKGSKYLSSFPFFRNNKLAGNIVAEINLNRFVTPLLNLYYIDGTHWQWIVNANTGVVLSNLGDDAEITLQDSISSEILNENEGFLIHEYSDGRRKRKLISAYYSLSVLNNDLGVVFSSNERKEISVYSVRYGILALANFLLLVLIGGFLLVLYREEVKKNDTIASSLLSLRMIIEHFPVGIMILDKNGIIKNINLTAQKMLFLDTDKGLIGKSFNDQFLLSNKYLLKENFSIPFDSAHFLLYEKDGNEVVIYRKEVKTYIAGDELTISALIDVSPFEKSRKQEAAANMAKSDFLAKMSHEIRTPMNGIMGMTEFLLKSDLPVGQKENVRIIKKSSALLMNVINDILDFSKIEAGKMMLEEIPFNLYEEMNHTVELFKSLAEEKNIELSSSIKPAVPAKLIGDPFRLRQVLSNLISNAIKFTEEGKIIISVELLDSYTTSVVLLFSVEDTGIGMSKENISSLFSTYQQGSKSTSRKYGGTGLGMSIAKQLVEMMNGEIWAESPLKLSENTKYPGTKISFTIESHSNERLEKKYDFSSFTSYNQLSALILNKNKDEKDRMHVILDSFGVNYNYWLYDEDSIDSILSQLENEKQLYQIIVLKDKPGYDGFPMAGRIKELKYSDNYLVIMISSNDRPGNYLKARKLGIDYYLIQPYESNEVFNLLNENFRNITEGKSVSASINQIRPDLKILVADDNLINQRVAQTIFKHIGYEIDIAVNGAEALKMAAQNEYDIIFMDLLMPEMDGFAAASEIRKINKTVPVIAMSASDDKSNKNDALASGMNDYLVKPVKVERIKQLLIKWFSEII